jgi:hypothetical protein
MPTVTTSATMDPQPRARVLFDEAEFDAAAVSATVLQISADGERDVRDGVGVPVAGGVLVTDYEIPPGVDVTYQARQYDINGAVIGLTGSATVRVDIPDGWAVFSDPLAPKNAVLVECLEGFGRELSRSREVSLYQVGNETIALMGALSGLQSVRLRVLTQSGEARDALATVLAAGSILVRTMPPMPVASAFYCVVAKPRRIPAGYTGVIDDWDMVANEVSRASIGVIAPVFTYGYYKAALAALDIETYGESKALWTTYLDSKLDPPPEA